MILCDVNVLLHALIQSSSAHEVCRSALTLAKGQDMGINRTILAGVIRIGSHLKIFSPPCNTADLFAGIESLHLLYRTKNLEPGPRHWPLFQQFVNDFRLSGAGVMDAWFAALAIEHDATWWTCDAGFAEYPGLKTRNLLENT